MPDDRAPQIPARQDGPDRPEQESPAGSWQFTPGSGFSNRDDQGQESAESPFEQASEPERSSDAQARKDFVTGIWVCALLGGGLIGMVGWVWTETVPFRLLWVFAGAALGALLAVVLWPLFRDQTRAIRQLDQLPATSANLLPAIDAVMKRSRGAVVGYAVAFGVLGAVAGGIAGVFASLPAGSLALQIISGIVGAGLFGTLGALSGAARGAGQTVEIVAMRQLARQYLGGRPARAAAFGALHGACMGAFGGWTAGSAMWPEHSLKSALILGAIAGTIGALGGWQMSNKKRP